MSRLNENADRTDPAIVFEYVGEEGLKDFERSVNQNLNMIVIRVERKESSEG